MFLWEEHISAILEKVGFKNTTHEKNICTGQFCGEKALSVHQVDDFALGCRQESTAKSVHAKVGVKPTPHNEAEAPLSTLAQLTPSMVALFHKLVTASSCLLNPASNVF